MEVAIGTPNPSTDRVDLAARDLTDGRGADFAFDAVGSSQLIKTGIDATRKGGTTVIAFVTDPDGYKIELIERDA